VLMQDLTPFQTRQRFRPASGADRLTLAPLTLA